MDLNTYQESVFFQGAQRKIFSSGWVYLFRLVCFEILFPSDEALVFC